MDDEWRDPEPIDWKKIRAELDDSSIVGDLDRVLQKQAEVRRALSDQPDNDVLSRLGAQLSDENILNALQNRQTLNRERAELIEIIGHADGATAQERAQIWLKLRAWIQRYEQVTDVDQPRLDVRELVAARRLYGENRPPPPQLHALAAFRDITNNLVNVARSIGPPLNVLNFHELAQAIERLLAGDCVAIRGLAAQVEAQVREIQSAPSTSDLNDAQQADPRGQTSAEAPETDPFREALIRSYVDNPLGHAILKTLLRATGPVRTAALKEAAEAARDEAELAIGRLRDGVEQAHQGRKAEEILRIMRDSCQRCSGGGPCPEHLALVRTPTRGSYVLTDDGRGFATTLPSRNP